MLKTMVSPAIAEKAEEIAIPKISLDEWVNNPSLGALEWVNGNLIEKTGMTLQFTHFAPKLSFNCGSNLTD
ncbi:hypothetical protein [Pseudanabaena yagii]|uniref:hypothetical protein n=1 Tax=Pseudanabaena yagii TaxID=2661615 RepID=UPI001B7CE263|nr:hypothetical protein [Pseudanabaena yagii]